MIQCWNLQTFLWNSALYRSSCRLAKFQSEALMINHGNLTKNISMKRRSWMSVSTSIALELFQPILEPCTKARWVKGLLCTCCRRDEEKSLTHNHRSFIYSCFVDATFTVNIYVSE